MQWLILTILLIFILLMAVAVWRLRDRYEIIGEFLEFLKERKLWWIMPMLLAFLAAGLFVVVLAKSGIATFVYVLH